MLLALDGQAHYSTAQLGRKWVHTTTDVTWAVANEGRWAGTPPCLKRTSTGDANAGGYLLWAPIMTQGGTWTAQERGVCGFAFKTLELARHHGGSAGIALDNALLVVASSGFYHFALTPQADGTLRLYTQAAAGLPTLRATSIGALIDNTWQFIEVKWYIDDTVGTCEVRVDGITVLDYEGPLISEQLGAPDVWASVKLLGMESELSLMQCWFSDFYLCDTEGSGDELRDFLGDVRVHTILPNGVGNASDWTPNTGANWAAQDDTPADDDTTYVSTDDVGDRDLYTYTDLPAGAEPLGFQTCILGKKESSGTASVSPSMRSGGTTEDATAQGIAGTTDYSYVIQPYDTNPVTGARATFAEINAAEFGALRA